MNLLDVRQLRVGYVTGPNELTPAVDGVSFQVDRGQTLGVVGESGCGKSTLARALMGYCRPGSSIMGGQVLLEDKDILQFDAQRLRGLRGRRIAIVPQNPLGSLTYHMKAGAQISEILQIHQGMDSAAARTQTLELFAATNLPEPEQIFLRYPHELSGGQRQRVVIAGALACQPSLMILDEPTTALDTTTEMQVLTLVKKLREKLNMALVYITHDLTLIDMMCEEVLVMLDGKVVERGQVKKIFSHAQTDYTKTLLSAIPRVDAEVDVHSRPTRVVGTGALLEVKHLEFSYPQRWSLSSMTGRRSTPLAVNDVSFALEPGRTLGLVGESGSGKSTIANIIVGLLAGHKGDLKFAGESLNASAKHRSLELRRRIQIIFQDPLSSLNPRRRVETILTRPLQTFFGTKGKAARDRAVALLEAMELSPALLTRFPRQLSGGQQQRVAIARAFAAEPDLVLCDEITSALDVSVQAHVLALLKALQEKSGAACVFISHDLGVVKQVADYVIVLHQGVVIEAGSTLALFGSPSHSYTRLLLAAASRREDYTDFAGIADAAHG